MRRPIPRWVTNMLLLLGLVLIGLALYRSAHVQGLQWPVLTTTVRHVEDGDTFEIEILGKTERVRMIGIDTPETIDRRKPVQCFGPEASERTKRLLTGATVTLTSDTATGDRDIYGRLLRYVTLADGSDYGELSLREGFAREYDFRGQRYAKRTTYRAAQIEAKTTHRGLWSADTCNGRR